MDKIYSYAWIHFSGIEPDASLQWKLVSIRFENTHLWQTPVVPIAIYREIQCFGDSLRFDPHFLCLVEQLKPFP